jgi:hypothetical protein
MKYRDIEMRTETFYITFLVGLKGDGQKKLEKNFIIIFLLIKTFLIKILENIFQS